MEHRSFSPKEPFEVATKAITAHVDAFLYRYNRFGQMEIVLRENRLQGDAKPLLQMFSKELPDHRDCSASAAIRILENFGVLGYDFKAKHLTEVSFKTENGKVTTTYAAGISDPDLFRIEKLLDVLYSSSDDERIRILPLDFLLNEKAADLMRYPDQLEALEYLKKITKYLNLEDRKPRSRQMSQCDNVYYGNKN